jgi:hypothetical protein
VLHAQHGEAAGRSPQDPGGHIEVERAGARGGVLARRALLRSKLTPDFAQAHQVADPLGQRACGST